MQTLKPNKKSIEIIPNAVSFSVKVNQRSFEYID